MCRLLAALRRVPVVPVPGGGHRLQQPVHVDDLAEAILAAGRCPTAIGHTYDLAGPAPITFRRLLREAADALGRRVRLVPVPLGACVAGLRLHEKLSAAPRLKAEQLRRLAEDKAFDITAARADLGFTPRPFATGIREEARLLWP
jgi:nucleoside-diphosphate-sugar epimerase